MGDGREVISMMISSPTGRLVEAVKMTSCPLVITVGWSSIRIRGTSVTVMKRDYFLQ